MIKTPSSAKLCIRCNRALSLNSFYPNKAWISQRYHDVWCKDCAIQFCKDKETLKQYCFANNRQWKDSYWESAAKKAAYVLNTDAEYLNPNTSPGRKEDLANRVTCRMFFSMMNLVQFYGYVENIGIDGEVTPPMEEDSETTDGEQKLRYNATWRGFYTDAQIQSLEDTYAQYEEDFVLDNVSTRDYARKVAKASLNADIAEDKMRRGKGTVSEYKEAQKIFDDLSKSSNFAACRRKPGDASGMGSLGEIIMRLEVSGALREDGFTFPQDDIDKIIQDFRQTLRSVGVEGQL